MSAQPEPNDDLIRAGVLGAIARGMSFEYAARADGITVAKAKQIATEAGYPDMTAVYVEWRRLRGVPDEGESTSTLMLRPEAVQVPRKTTAPRPDLSVAKVRAQGLFGRQKLAIYRDGDELVLTKFHEFEQEPVRNFTPITTPAREPSQADSQEDSFEPEIESPQVIASEPAAKPDTPTPRQLPCEVCGIGVLASYIERTGRQRHGHHPDGAS